MNCIEFFSQNSSNKQKCKLLQDIPQDKLLAWELETASEYSPCPVSNTEHLYRQILSPIHYDEETKTLTSAAFDDASSIGLSVNRRSYTTEEHISQMANDRVNLFNKSNPDKTQRSFFGIVRFVCNDIRQITVKMEQDLSPFRGFCVYDTALEHDKSHSDICQVVKSKAHGRSARSKLRDLANDFIAGQTPIVTQKLRPSLLRWLFLRKAGSNIRNLVTKCLVKMWRTFWSFIDKIGYQ